MTPEPLEFPTGDGLILRGDGWGNPAARPVLMLHGGGQTRHAWGGVAERLALAGWYAVSIDQRGHGESDWVPEARFTPEAYKIDAFASDFRAVARTFRTPPVAVGASLGGVAAMLGVGEGGSDLARALVLVDITPRVQRAGVERIVNFMRRHMDDGFASLEEAADYVASYLPGRRRPKDLSGLQKNLRQREDGRWYWHWDPKFVTDIDARMADRDPERLASAARSIRVPCLLVRGGSSDLVSPENAREFLEIVPQAEFVDVGGAGHMVAGDRNDAFARAVTEFLEELRP